LLEKSDTSKGIEEYLRRSCQSGGGILPRKIVDILGRTFDPVSDEIYWTHALKCVPQINNKQIQTDWSLCASHCSEYLRRELKLISAKNLVLVTFGSFAVTMCQHILFGKPITNLEKITQYFISHDPELKYVFNGKNIHLFPFIHPRYEEVHLKRLGENGQLKRNENIMKIREII
jgi:uracil-DNA glycosylase